jgi:flagellar hook-length control protein FliK
MAAHGIEQAGRTITRRGGREEGVAEDAFAVVLAETVEDAVEEEPELTRDTTQEETSVSRDDKPPPTAMPFHHFLQPEQHVPRARSTEEQSGFAALTRLPAGAELPSVFPKPSRQAHWPVADKLEAPRTAAAEAEDLPAWFAAPAPLRGRPDEPSKPLIAPPTQSQQAAAATKTDDKAAEAKAEHNNELNVEAVTPEVVVSPETALTPQPAPAQAQPPAMQISRVLAPAINQAQAILAILEKAGDPVPVVKTLQFGLRPQDLGEVRITLSLAAASLALRIETQNEEAARRLELDRGLLDTMLVQAGIGAERSQIDIRVSRFEPAQPAAFPDAQAWQGGSAASAFNGSGSQRNRPSPERAQSTESHGHAASSSAHSVERDRGGIYI